MDSSDSKQPESGRARSHAAERADLEAPIGDDTELTWLQARALDPAAPEPVPGLARQYAQLERLLSELPAVPGEAEWHADVLHAAKRQQRRTRVGWVLGGGGLAAAAAAVLAVQVLSDSEPPAKFDQEALVVKIVETGRARGGELRGGVGGQLTASGWTKGAPGELRVYRGQSLIARCPDGPRCVSSGGPFGAQIVDLTFDIPSIYRVIFAQGPNLTALPLEPMDAYLEALGTGAEISSRSINVR